MLAKISAFFQSLNEEESSDPKPLSVEMACTVLLCEVMRADGHLDDAEQSLLTKIISKQFSLSPSEVKELIQQAIELSEHAIDFHQFTSKINSHYSPQEKEHIITLLWQLAMADGEIASIEDHIIRRISDLLHLSHAQYIRAKETVKKHK
ncbi:TerB family tellurite resistance protein [Thalassotalea castellviae]|uniref:TerB family tellurite resistance protein n=1 Tax=Thalassotalea castellviae TaxID=3075612 RepID=A0ABU2ZZH4_9GAMM|nr:TerB family tellurite resistance protein [Thalassotalea sp. W431]MDT0603325.1 TerB family tellurite resistance protein [Thalassotalea sp. W431]